MWNESASAKIYLLNFGVNVGPSQTVSHTIKKKIKWMKIQWKTMDSSFLSQVEKDKILNIYLQKKKKKSCASKGSTDCKHGYYVVVEPFMYKTAKVIPLPETFSVHRP